MNVVRGSKSTHKPSFGEKQGSIDTSIIINQRRGEKNMKSTTFERNMEAVSPVIGVILMVAITVILAAVIGSYVFGMGPPAQAPDIHFSDLEATTDGNVSATVTGSGNVTLASLKWLVDNNEIATTSIYVNTVGGDDSTYIGGGDRIVIATGNTWTIGQEIRITITDKATGDLLADIAINAKST